MKHPRPRVYRFGEKFEVRGFGTSYERHIVDNVKVIVSDMILFPLTEDGEPTGELPELTVMQTIIEEAMWAGRKYGHDDYGIDGLEESWYADVERLADAIEELF